MIHKDIQQVKFSKLSFFIQVYIKNRKIVANISALS